VGDVLRVVLSMRFLIAYIKVRVESKQRESILSI